MSGPVRRQSAPAATPREYPTASACHPWAWLPPFRFVASAPPIGSPSLDLPQTLPRLRGRTPPPQPHVQPVHASHANRASASWFSRIVISTRLAHPQAFENPLRTPSDSIRPDYALVSELPFPVSSNVMEIAHFLMQDKDEVVFFNIPIVAIDCRSTET